MPSPSTEGDGSVIVVPAGLAPALIRLVRDPEARIPTRIAPERADMERLSFALGANLPFRGITHARQEGDPQGVTALDPGGDPGPLPRFGRRTVDLKQPLNRGLEPPPQQGLAIKDGRVVELLSDREAGEPVGLAELRLVVLLVGRTRLIVTNGLGRRRAGLRLTPAVVCRAMSTVPGRLPSPTTRAAAPSRLTRGGCRRGAGGLRRILGAAR